MTARIFVCGDVMLGRGVDQIQSVSCDPAIYECYMKDARNYVKIAVEKNGPLPKNRPPSYVWGDAISVLDKFKPDVKLINLETSITMRGKPWPGKGIQYRMHPANVQLLEEAKIDVVTLGNNHVLDWNYEGLHDSLQALTSRKIQFVGAGENQERAEMVSVHPLANHKPSNVIVYGLAHISAGIPPEWGATSSRAGVNFVSDLTPKTAENIIDDLKRQRKSDKDIIVVSIHWGGNWGFDVPPEFRRFAHCLIDSGLVSLIHGHSSHHVKAFELYKQRLILYGCGDFLNDYEGIWGDDKEQFKDYLSLMYFVDFDVVTKNISNFHMVPTRLRHLRVNFASPSECDWLVAMLNRECSKYGCFVEKTKENVIRLKLH